MLRYFIVDDDLASRRMLAQIISESGIGVVIGEAESGKKSISQIMATRPDFVLIDLLMPEIDGIETIELLRNEGFQGMFIMISQVVTKEMVGEAYEMGVEFFIHKPINRIEVSSILKKTAEQFRLKDSLMQIRESLAHIGTTQKTQAPRSVKEIVMSILNDMGITGETGSDDIVKMIEVLMEKYDDRTQLPPLKDLYEIVAEQASAEVSEMKKESKAIEQRIRRMILAAINNLASLGAIDYTNSAFEYYAPRYFDFQEVLNRMKQMEEDNHRPTRVKINIRKFLQMLYRDTFDKYMNGS